MANTIKESKGVATQKDVLTSVRCDVCSQLMRQNEIGVEVVFNHNRGKGEPKRLRLVKHTKNCRKAA